jgi:hypothetical protein
VSLRITYRHAKTEWQNANPEKKFLDSQSDGTGAEKAMALQPFI